MKFFINLIFVVLFSVANLEAQTYDYLQAETVSGSGVTTNNSKAWSDVVSITINVGSNTSDVKYVLVTASMNMRVEGSHTGAREANYNIYRSDDVTDESGLIKRQIKANSEAGVESWGVGTLVHIFDVSELSGDVTYTLEHSNQGGTDNLRNVYSSVRLTAVALSTANDHYELSNDGKYIGDSSITTVSSSFEAVAGLTTDSISLPIKGDIYVSASINGKANGSVVAEYQLQSSNDGGVSWIDFGKAVKRSMINTWDDGIVSLVGLLRAQDADDDYQFRVVHRRVSGTATVSTHNCNLVAVALAHGGGGFFPAFYNEVGSTGIDITGLSAEADTVVYSNFTALPDISNVGPGLFVNTQYLVSPSNLDGIDRMRGGNQLMVTGASSASAEEYYRYMPDNNNYGSGGYIGLMEDLDGEGAYSIIMKHQIAAISAEGGTGDEVLNTSSVILTGFQTYDQPSYNWGGTTTDWGAASNWSSSAVPTKDDDIVIANDGVIPVISSTTSAVCNNLEVEDGATLVIESAENNSGSLIVNGTFSGQIAYKRWVSAGKWHLVSPPVEGQDIYDFAVTNVATNAIATNADKYGVAPYDNSSATVWQHYTTSDIASAGDFVLGKGYAVMRTSEGTVSFEGTAVTYDVNVDITHEESPGDAWNLLGNPFSASINANSPADVDNNVLTANASQIHDSYEAIYLWEAASNDYTIVNNTSDATYIAPGQAFLVCAVEGGGSVDLKTNMRTEQSNVTFRSKRGIAVPTINLQVKAGSDSSTAVIKYYDNTTTGLDPGYDAGAHSTKDFMVYTHLVGDASNTVDFAIQCLPLGEYNHVIPVGLDASAGSEVTFSVDVEDLPAGTPVYLEDQDQGVFTELSAGSNYSVTLLEESQGIGRFFLYTEEPRTVGFTSKPIDITLAANPEANVLTIMGQVGAMAQLELYDISGRQVLFRKLQESYINTISMSQLTDGVYIVNIRTLSGVSSQKINWE